MARFPRRRSSALPPRPTNTKAIATRAPRPADAVATPATADQAVAVAERRPLTSAQSRLRRGSVRNVTVMAVAAGLVGTLAIPAYAFAPGSDQQQFGATAATQLTKAQPQDVEVADDVIAAPLTKDGYAAVTGEEIAAAEAAAAEAARQAAQAEMASYAASYNGPSAAQLAASPVYSSADLASVFSVAQSYLGVPYVYGGATPAGFDCSGLVMYVYAQFGISLPHSSAGQGAAGTRISESQAQPGDLVVMPGHIGFYAGNGQILHAPYSGTSVRIQPIWTSDYYIVRL